MSNHLAMAGSKNSFLTEPGSNYPSAKGRAPELASAGSEASAKMLLVFDSNTNINHKNRMGDGAFSFPHLWSKLHRQIQTGNPGHSFPFLIKLKLRIGSHDPVPFLSYTTIRLGCWCGLSISSSLSMCLYTTLN